MKSKLNVLFAVLMLTAAIETIRLFAQDASTTPPHASGITPPPIPFATAFLHRYPTNTMLLHIPPGKIAEMFQLGSMQTDELLERVRTNRYNLYLVELRDAGPPQLRSALISEEDELVLSNHHRATPQHP